MERTSQQKGKRAEFLVFGELIKRKADLYLPVIDTGIDAIVRRENGAFLKVSDPWDAKNTIRGALQEGLGT